MLSLPAGAVEWVSLTIDMTDPLAKLFGSADRVKLLRLFLFNPKINFTAPEVVQRSRVQARTVARELTLFQKIGLVRSVRVPRSKGVRYMLDSTFPYCDAMQSLLINAAERRDDIYGRIRNIGSVRLVVLSGIFVGDWDGRVDLLIVVDRLQEKKLEAALSRLESELGKELSYVVLSTQDFFYRHSINDHLVRDVLDFPHYIAFDRLNIGLT